MEFQLNRTSVRLYSAFRARILYHNDRDLDLLTLNVHCVWIDSFCPYVFTLHYDGAYCAWTVLLRDVVNSKLRVTRDRARTRGLLRELRIAIRYVCNIWWWI